MKTTSFISLVTFFFILGVPSQNFAGNCATELVFPYSQTSASSFAKKSKSNFKEKVATWVVKRQLKKAKHKKHRKAGQQSQKDELQKRADKAVTFGALSIFLPFFAIFGIINAIGTVFFLKKNNGLKKQKVAAWFGLILSLLGLGLWILLAPYVVFSNG